MSSAWSEPRESAWSVATDELVPVEVVSEQELASRERGRVGWPLFLFAATCLTTYMADGPVFAVAVMFILLCHEFGHYIQARRYGVPASLPYFIPMPISPLGTMGAVIAMRGQMGDRRALFDIGITGPLAGLGPALVCSVIGLMWSRVEVINPAVHGTMFGEPLLFQWLERWIFGPVAAHEVISIHPLGLAGWVGIFITALNLIPIGQLDGGHILYALLRTKAHWIATLLMVLAIASVVLAGYYTWMLMLTLIVIMGPRHPPTANDEVPLGWPRVVLGWATLSFLIIGFTPVPLIP